MADHAKAFSPPTVSFSQPKAGFRFFVASCYQPQSYPTQRQHAALRIFYPENLSFFCYGGCSGIDPGVVGFLAMDHPRLPAALDLPTHSYRPPGSFQPKWSACFSVASATTVSLSGIHYRTNLWPALLSHPRRSFLLNSNGSSTPGLFHSRAAGTWLAAAVCLAFGMCC